MSFFNLCSWCSCYTINKNSKLTKQIFNFNDLNSIFLKTKPNKFQQKLKTCLFSSSHALHKVQKLSEETKTEDKQENNSLRDYENDCNLFYWDVKKIWDLPKPLLPPDNKFDASSNAEFKSNKYKPKNVVAGAASRSLSGTVRVQVTRVNPVEFPQLNEFRSHLSYELNGDQKFSIGESIDLFEPGKSNYLK